ncbi:TRAP transporter small permease [Leucothrix sargassi]|nr:TRAP transporter small permease [Leucothrix sargassi]
MFQSAFLGLSKIANSIATFANIIGTLVVMGLVVIINYDVFARGLFNEPFRGAVEVVQFSMVLIVFLQLPDVVRVGRLTRSDGMLLLLDYKRPKLARIIRRFVNLLSAAIMSMVAYAMFPEFIEMWESKDYFGIPGVFTAPWWPIKLIILSSAALCTVLFLLKLVIPKAGDRK